MAQSHAEDTSLDAPWRAVRVGALVEDETPSDGDVDYARKVGIASQTAWTHFITRDPSPPEEINLCKEDIGINGGYPDTVDWPDGRIGELVASAWPVTDTRELMAVIEDLIATRPQGPDLSFLRAQALERLDDPLSVIVAARDMGARRASGLLIYSRELSLYDGRVTFDVFPVALAGDEGSHSKAALVACLHMQMKADLETIILSMAKSGDIRPFGTTCHSGHPGTDDLAEAMAEMVNYAQDNLFEGEELPDWLDFGKVDMERAAAFCM